MGLFGAALVNFPMEQNLKLIPIDGEIFKHPSLQGIGKLICLTINHPNIIYSVHLLSQFMHHPCKPHLDVVVRVLQYLKGTLVQGIFLASKNYLNLIGYCNVDWGGCSITRSSISNIVFFLASLLFIGRRRNKQLFVVPRQSYSIEQWYSYKWVNLVEITFIGHINQEFWSCHITLW